MEAAHNRSDQIYVAARPLLRKRLGLAVASSVEQLYRFLQSEYTAIIQLFEQLDFALTEIQLSLARSQQALNMKQTIDLAAKSIEDSLIQQESYPAVPETTAENLGARGLMAGTLNLEESLVKMGHHLNAVRTYNDRLGSVISLIAKGVPSFLKLMRTLDDEVALTLLQVDQLSRDCRAALAYTSVRRGPESTSSCLRNSSIAS